MSNRCVMFTNMKGVRFGSSLAKRRQDAGLSRKQLATKTGVALSELERLEEGCLQRIEEKKLIDIARAVRVELKGGINGVRIVDLFLNWPEETNNGVMLI